MIRFELTRTDSVIIRMCKGKVGATGDRELVGQ